MVFDEWQNVKQAGAELYQAQTSKFNLWLIDLFIHCDRLDKVYSKIKKTLHNNPPIKFCQKDI